jgi:hypothetical protein
MKNVLIGLDIQYVLYVEYPITNYNSPLRKEGAEYTQRLLLWLISNFSNHKSLITKQTTKQLNNQTTNPLPTLLFTGFIIFG